MSRKLNKWSSRMRIWVKYWCFWVKWEYLDLRFLSGIIGMEFGLFYDSCFRLGFLSFSVFFLRVGRREGSVGGISEVFRV